MAGSVAMAAAVGLAFGAVCSLLRLPAPAPQAFAGIVAVVAVYVGWALVSAAR